MFFWSCCHNTLINLVVPLKWRVHGTCMPLPSPSLTALPFTIGPQKVKDCLCKTSTSTLLQMFNNFITKHYANWIFVYHIFWFRDGFEHLFHCRCPGFFVFMISFDVRVLFEWRQWIGSFVMSSHDSAASTVACLRTDKRPLGCLQCLLWYFGLWAKVDLCSLDALTWFSISVDCVKCSFLMRSTSSFIRNLSSVTASETQSLHKVFAWEIQSP